MTRGSILVGMLLAIPLSSPGLVAQGGELLAGLASADPAVRARASRTLTIRKPGDWVILDLDRAARAPAEVRQRFISALAKNRALLPLLVGEFGKRGLPPMQTDSKGDLQRERYALIRDCLLAYYRANRLPAPLDPTAVSVLPAGPLDLRGVRDLMDLWDRMLVAGSFGLPWILDPRLDREGAAGRQSLASLTGAYVLRELLPGIERPRSSVRMDRAQGLVTRIYPEGVVVTASAGPRSMAEFFLLTLQVYLGKQAEGGERAALCLAALDLPGLGDFFLLELKGQGGEGGQRKAYRKKRAQLGLVGEWHRGRSLISPARLGPDLLELYRQDQRWRYLVGSCLRDLIQDKGELAEWYGDPRKRWKESPVDALLFAGIRLPSLEPWMMQELESILRGRRTVDGATLASLLDALARLDGPLPVRVRDGLVRSLGQGRIGPSQGDSKKSDPSRTGLGEFILAQTLKLLDRRGGDWLPLAPLGPGALGSTRAEGRIWVRQLGRMGEKGWLVRLKTLLAAEEVTPALLELATAEATPDKPPSLYSWALLQKLQDGEIPEGLGAAPGAQASLLMDLGFHLLRAEGEGGRERWKPIYESFDRLQRLVEKGPLDSDEDLARALGKSLGRHLLRLPRGPHGKRAGQWLGGWLAKQGTRAIGLSASILCLRSRDHLLRDIDASMTSGLPPLEAVMLRRRLLLASRGRPAELGQEPVDTEDPLLRPGR